MSVMKASSAAGFIVLVMPNSCAALSELTKSPPALASPSTCAPEPCAWSRNDEKSEVASGTPHFAQRFAAVGFDDLGRGVVAAACRRRSRRSGRTRSCRPALTIALAVPLAKRRRVVGVVHGVGRAVLVGQRGAGGADRDERHLLLRGHLGHGDADAGVGAAEEHVDAVLIGPLAELRRADIGLVLMVGDRAARSSCRATVPPKSAIAILAASHAARADDVGIQARHVVDVADHDLVGAPAPRRSPGRRRGSSRRQERES